MSALDLSEYIRVVNRTGETIEGRYDGKDYIFLNDEPTDVHQSAAVHIFGFGQGDKVAAFHRLGWLNSMSLKEAMALLGDIEFQEVPSPAVNISSGKKSKRSKTSSPTPLADAGVDEGEGNTSPTEALDFEDAVGNL